MVRIGGDRICEIALTAASNMAVLPLVKKPSREVDTPEGFGKGFDKSLPAPGETRPPSKTRGCHDPRPGTLSRQQNHPARGRPARRPAAREDISVDGSEAALDPRRICRRRAAFRGRLVPAGKDLSAIRRRARHHRDRGLAARRLRHRADAERARRQRGAGLRRRRSGDGGLGDRGAQPGQCQPLARIRHRQRQAALRAARRQRAQAGGEFRDLDGAGLFDRGGSRSEGSACG